MLLWTLAGGEFRSGVSIESRLRKGVLVWRSIGGMVGVRRWLIGEKTGRVGSFRDTDLEASAMVGVELRESKTSSDSRGWKSRKLSLILNIGEYLVSR